MSDNFINIDLKREFTIKTYEMCTKDSSTEKWFYCNLETIGVGNPCSGPGELGDASVDDTTTSTRWRPNVALLTYFLLCLSHLVERML